MGHIHDIPPGVLLSWPAPNYTNPQTRSQALVVVDTLFPALSFLVVAFRTYTRVYLKRWFGMDDVLITLALVSYSAESPYVLLWF